METIKPKEISTEEKIKKMRNATCEFLVAGEEGVERCGKKQIMTVSLPLLYINEEGETKAHEGVSLGVPLCEYHMFIAMSGHFGIIEKNGKHSLYGDFKEVELIETVIMAQLMSGRFQEETKAIEKGKEEAEKMAKEMKAKKTK